jgi:hypothetical protein
MELGLMRKTDHIQAHKHSSLHRDEIERSEACGCFYCLAVFKPDAIEDWTDEQDGVGQTSLCPQCGIDSVIGSESGFPIGEAFLKEMHHRWF